MPLASLRSAVAAQSHRGYRHLRALMYGFLTDSSTHLWKRWASPRDKVTPVLLLSRAAESQVYRGPGKVSWDECGNVNCTQAAVTHSWLHVCAYAGSGWGRLWAGAQHSGAHMCFSIMCRTDFCLSSCLSSCLSVSLLRHILLEPGGRGGNVFGSTRELFILGTEVLQAVISLKQHPSGSGEAVRHHRYENWNRSTGQAGSTHTDQWEDVKTFHNDNNDL